MATRPKITPAELLAVVSLFSLLLFAAAAGLLDRSRPMVHDGGLGRVALLAELARVESVRRGVDCRVEYREAPRVSRVIATDSGEELHRTRLPRGVHLAREIDGRLVEGRLAVAFDAGGKPTEGATAILVRAPDEHGALWIGSDGELSVESFLPGRGS